MMTKIESGLQLFK